MPLLTLELRSERGDVLDRVFDEGAVARLRASSDTGGTVRSYPDERVRISILWKAQVLTETVVHALTPEQIVDIITRDLATRKSHVPAAATEPTSDDTWIEAVHRTYYRTVAANP